MLVYQIFYKFGFKELMDGKEKTTAEKIPYRL